MKRLLVLMLLTLLCLSGCRVPFSLPRAQEPGHTAIAAVLGLSMDQNGSLRLYAASQRRGEQEARRYESAAPSLSAAFLDSRDQGTETVSYAHVEHLVLDEEFAQADLDSLLAFCFQNKEQSVESKLWIVRDLPMEKLFGEKEDPVGRLSTLRLSGKAGTSLPLLSIREIAAKEADDGTLLIPALRLAGDEVIFDSYALLKDGVIIGYLEGDTARAAAMLAGATLYWNETVILSPEQEVVLQLSSKGCSVKPVLQNGSLKSLDITCRVQGKVTQRWTQPLEPELLSKTERQVEKLFTQALEDLKSYGADGVGLRRKAGLSQFWNWDIIDRQFQDRFSQLPCNLQVELKLSESF